MSTDSRTRREVVVTAVLAVVCVVYLAQAFALPTTSPNQADVGPRTYPLLVGALLGISTLLLAAQAVARRRGRGRPEHDEQPGAVADEQEPDGVRSGYLVTAIAMVVVTAIYLQVLELLGFLLATAVYLAVLTVLMSGDSRNPRKWVTPVVYGCLAAVAVDLVFGDFLGVVLPPGLLAF